MTKFVPYASSWAKPAMPAILLFYLSVFHLGATASLPSQQKTDLMAETPPVKRSDDVSNEDLKIMIQEQATVIQSLQAKATQADAKITALESQVRKQGKPAA